jgi:molybdenum cofactor biosynthesis enzyme MoaA
METIGSPVRSRETGERRCHSCGGGPLRTVTTISGGENLFCTNCHRCWRPEFGYLLEVNTYACPGCDDRSRCRAR